MPLKERRLNFGNKWDFAPAPEDSKNYVIAPQHELFIGGKFVKPTSGKYFESINPATEQTLTTIAAANADDVDSAVKAARKAYDKVWSKMPGRERELQVSAYRIPRASFRKRRASCAVLETMDGGKTIKESRDVDLPLRGRALFYYAGWADKFEIRVPRQNAAAARRRGADHSLEFPAAHGRVEDPRPRSRAATPWCSSPPRPRALRRCGWRRFFRRRNAAGSGVVNIVTGAAENRRGVIVNHPDINKLAFTGSTERSASASRRRSRARRRRLTLELGGKGGEHFCLRIAPIDQAIEGVINGIYFNQGHVCCAGSRLFVQEGIYRTVIKKLRDRIQTLRVGNPLDKNTDIGAINSKPQLDKIRELVQSGVDEGAGVDADAVRRSHPKAIGSRRRFSRESRTRIAWPPRKSLARC